MNRDSSLSPPYTYSDRLKPGLLLALTVTVFHLVTIMGGHGWYECDFALYLQHVKNILEGVDYSRSGYLINPYRIISPQAYPPVLPLILTPFYGLFGLNFWLLKAVIVIFHGVMLLIAFIWAGKYLKSPYHYFFPVLMGINPAVWANLNSIYSDTLFLFFMFLVIFLVDWRDRFPEKAGERWWLWIVMGILIYLAFGTRTVGVVLAPSLVVHDLITRRRLTLFSVGSSLLALGLVILQGFLIGPQGSGVTGYMTQLTALGPRNLFNLFLAVKNLGRLTFGITPCWFSYPFFTLTMISALVGLYSQLKQGLAFIHLIVVCYLGVLFVFPHQPTRYLFVILPFFLLWVLMGLQVVGERLKQRQKLVVSLIILASLFISYGFRYYIFITVDIKEPRVTDQAALEVYQFLDRETDEDSRIMFSNPRVLTYFTSRVSSVWHCDSGPESLLAYMKRIRATHLVLPLWKPECIGDLTWENPGIFHQKMANEMFKIYEIDTDKIP